MSGTQQQLIPDPEELIEIKDLYVRYLNLAQVIKDLPVEEELNAFIADRKNLVRNGPPLKESGQSKYCKFIEECAKNLDEMYEEMVNINKEAELQGTTTHGLLDRIFKDTNPHGSNPMMTRYIPPSELMRGRGGQKKAVETKAAGKSELAEALHVLANQNIRNFNGTSMGNYQIVNNINKMIDGIEDHVFTTTGFITHKLQDASYFANDQLPEDFRDLPNRGQGLKEQREQALATSNTNIQKNVKNLKDLASLALELPENELMSKFNKELKTLTNTMNDAFSTVESYLIYSDKQSSPQDQLEESGKMKEKLLEIKDNISRLEYMTHLPDLFKAVNALVDGVKTDVNVNCKVHDVASFIKHQNNSEVVGLSQVALKLMEATGTLDESNYYTRDDNRMLLATNEQSKALGELMKSISEACSYHNKDGIQPSDSGWDEFTYAVEDDWPGLLKNVANVFGLNDQTGIITESAKKERAKMIQPTIEQYVKEVDPTYEPHLPELFKAVKAMVDGVTGGAVRDVESFINHQNKTEVVGLSQVALKLMEVTGTLDKSNNYTRDEIRPLLASQDQRKALGDLMWSISIACEGHSKDGIQPTEGSWNEGFMCLVEDWPALLEDVANAYKLDPETGAALPVDPAKTEMGARSTAVMTVRDLSQESKPAEESGPKPPGGGK